MPNKKKIEVSNILFRKLMKLKDEAGFAETSLENFFKYLTRNIKLRPDVHEIVQVGTKEGFLALWLNNFAENLPVIRSGLSISALAEPMPVLLPPDEVGNVNWKNPPKGSAVIIGRGPDVWAHNHVDMLSEAVHSGKYTGLVCATDGMLIECLQRDLIPDLTLTVDGSTIITKWYNHPLVKKHGSKLKLVFLVTVHNEVTKIALKNKCQIYWAVPLWDDWRRGDSYTRISRLLTATAKEPNGIPAISAGGNCGSCLWAATHDLFKRAPIALIGFDMGYPEGTKLEDTPYFSTLLRTAKENTPREMQHLYHQLFHPIYRKHAWVDAVFFNYRQNLLDMHNSTYPWYRAFGGTINCTEGGTLWGPGITCTTFQKFLKEHPT